MSLSTVFSRVSGDFQRSIATALRYPKYSRGIIFFRSSC